MLRTYRAPVTTSRSQAPKGLASVPARRSQIRGRAFRENREEPSSPLPPSTPPPFPSDPPPVTPSKPDLWDNFLEDDSELTKAWNQLQARWAAVPDKKTVVALAGGATLLLWLASRVLSTVDGIPVLPDLLTFVGFVYSATFFWRYVLFYEGRQDLRTAVTDLYRSVRGTVEGDEEDLTPPVVVAVFEEDTQPAPQPTVDEALEAVDQAFKKAASPGKQGNGVSVSEPLPVFLPWRSDPKHGPPPCILVRLGSHSVQHARPTKAPIQPRPAQSRPPAVAPTAAGLRRSPGGPWTFMRGPRPPQAMGNLGLAPAHLGPAPSYLGPAPRPTTSITTRPRPGPSLRHVTTAATTDTAGPTVDGDPHPPIDWPPPPPVPCELQPHNTTVCPTPTAAPHNVGPGTVTDDALWIGLAEPEAVGAVSGGQRGPARGVDCSEQAANTNPCPTPGSAPHLTVLVADDVWYSVLQGGGGGGAEAAAGTGSGAGDGAEAGRCQAGIPWTGVKVALVPPAARLDDRVRLLAVIRGCGGRRARL